MALFTIPELQQRADKARQKFNFTKTASSILLESASSLGPDKAYDIFLSHNILDAKSVLGLKEILVDFNYKVYVDWIEDPHLDRNNVTSEIASHLRKRLTSSKSLFFVTSQNSVNSKWMPWECGYFDAFKGKVAIVPVAPKANNTNHFNGQEYLGLYPYATKDKDTNGNEALWIHKDESYYVSFSYWLKTSNNSLAWQSS
jgi:hypothetical protein